MCMRQGVHHATLDLCSTLITMSYLTPDSTLHCNFTHGVLAAHCNAHTAAHCKQYILISIYWLGFFFRMPKKKPFKCMTPTATQEEKQTEEGAREVVEVAVEAEVSRKNCKKSTWHPGSHLGCLRWKRCWSFGAQTCTQDTKSEMHSKRS